MIDRSRLAAWSNAAPKESKKSIAAPVWANIPPELTACDQWVLWRFEEKPGHQPGDKLTKIPYSTSGAKASTVNPDTWATFDAARKRYEQGGFDGVGFVVTESDPFCGFDFDHVVDAFGTVVDAKVAKWIKQLGSYTEISPSGDGLRCFVKAKLPPQGRRVGPYEVYESGRYLTITGNKLADAPGKVQARQTEVNTVHAEVFAERTKQKSKLRLVDAGKTSNQLSDDEVIARASKASDKFAMLFEYGDFAKAGFPSQSEADASLCSSLAFWTCRDPEKMDRIFRRSKLMRDKWDGQRGALTYGQLTIENACESCTDLYNFDGITTIKEINLSHKFIKEHDSAYDMRSGTLRLKDRFLSHYASKRITVPVADKKGNITYEPKAAGVVWWNSTERSEHFDLVWEPGQPRFLAPEDGKGDGLLNVNLWQGWHYDAAPGDVTLWNVLLDHVFGAGTPERHYAEQWSAHHVQFPAIKPFTAILIWGLVQGCGKSLFGEVLGSVHNPYYAEINPKMLRGDFNAAFRNKNFILANEIVSTDKRVDADMLKDMITRPKLEINIKFQPQYTIKDTIAYVLTSNSPTAAYVEDHDRRLFICQIEKRLDPELGSKIGEWARSPQGRAALRYHLEHVDLTGYMSKAPAPMTASKQAMIRDSRSRVDDQAAELLENARDEDDGAPNADRDLVTIRIAASRVGLDPEKQQKSFENSLRRQGAHCYPRQLGRKLGRPRVWILTHADYWLSLDIDAITEAYASTEDGKALANETKKRTKF